MRHLAVAKITRIWKNTYTMFNNNSYFSICISGVSSDGGLYTAAVDSSSNRHKDREIILDR